MKILFLLKNAFTQERLGIMLLSSWLKKYGHSVELFITEGLSADEVIQKVGKYDPKVLAYSIMTGEHTYYLDLNQSIKEKLDIYTVFGGPHPTFAPDMIEYEGVDSVCLGEGDLAFPELINRMEEGRDFYDVDNFWFKVDGEIIKNEIGPLVEMDDLPLPDRDLMYKADPTLGANGIKTSMTMRGCPYLCTYCFNSAYNDMTKGKGDVMRSRTVDSVIAEFKQIQEYYPLEFVQFLDDTFLLHTKEWMEEFAEKFPKEIGVPFSCTIRPNVAMDGLVKSLKNAGVWNVWMGVECGNNEVATAVLKRHLSNERIYEAMDVLHKYDIRVFAQNLIGLPIDNPVEVDFETLDFNIKLKPYFAWSSILYPFPATPIGQYAIDNGYFHGDFTDVNVSNKSTTCLAFKDTTVQRKIDNLHKLFGFIVEFPILRPITNFLISLPLTGFYTYVFFLFFGYKYIWNKWTWKERVLKVGAYIPFFFKYVSSLEKKTTMKKDNPMSLGWKADKTTYPQPETMVD
jgi:anaerobic magnesium-protoporphyrin IX monomethyl ester cyclase